MKMQNGQCDTTPRVTVLALLVLIAIGCGACGVEQPHFVPSSQYLAGSNEDLWPYENGYLAVRSRVNWPTAEDITSIQFVFDFNALEEAYRTWASVRDAKSTSGMALRTHDTTGHKVTRIGVAYAEASRIFVNAAKKHTRREPRLVEAARQGRFWYFNELKKDKEWLVRKSICKEDRAEIVKWFWPVFENGRFRDRRENVFWDDFGCRYPKRMIRSIGSAPVRVVIEWGNHEHVGAGVDNSLEETAFLAVPGLGIVATGDLRPATPLGDRKISTCAVRIIVPSQCVDIYDPTRKIKILKRLD